MSVALAGGHGGGTGSDYDCRPQPHQLAVVVVGPAPILIDGRSIYIMNARAMVSTY